MRQTCDHVSVEFGYKPGCQRGEGESYCRHHVYRMRGTAVPTV